jgi:ComF family protein
MKVLRVIADSIRSLFTPDVCLGCNKRAESCDLKHGVCHSCWDSLPDKKGSICTICGCSMASDQPQLAYTDFKCQACRKKKRIPYLRIRSLLLYESPARELIHLFKFQGMLSIGKELSAFLASSLRSEKHYMTEIDLVVPVPLHLLRFIGRGFNQSEIIATEIADSTKLPLANTAIERIRNTAPQSRLYGDERQTNLSGAFVADPKQCKGKRILLVDDVVTTGNTIKECSRALKKAGAVSVSVVTICRAENV